VNFRIYFLFSLFLPLIFGCASFLLPVVQPSNTGFGTFTWIVIVTRYSLYLGGIPYAIFASLVFFWSQNRTLGQLKRWVWLFPLFFMPFLAAALVVLYYPDILDALKAFMQGFAIYGLLYGYFYVVIAYLGWWVLEKWRSRHAELRSPSGMDRS